MFLHSDNSEKVCNPQVIKQDGRISSDRRMIQNIDASSELTLNQVYSNATPANFNNNDEKDSTQNLERAYENTLNVLQSRIAFVYTFKD